MEKSTVPHNANETSIMYDWLSIQIKIIIILGELLSEDAGSF